MASRPFYIPVILGTVRQGRMSAHVARVVTEEIARRREVETDLIDIARLPLPIDDAGQAIKDIRHSISRAGCSTHPCSRAQESF